MQYEYQDLDTARPFIQRTIRQNQKHGYGTSIRALFRNLRKKQWLSFFGDWPIMWIILDEYKKQKIKTTSSKIQSAIKQSEEYQDLKKREKMEWLRILSEDIYKGIGNGTK